MNNLFSTPGDDVFQGQSRDNVELAKAWAGTTLAYAITQVGGNLGRVLTPGFGAILLISGVVCGLGFVIHELAHRIVARRYGAQAHFVANNQMLLVSLLISLAGLFLAAPGAVWYRGMITKKQNGQIALAGPASNFVLSALFFAVLAVIIVGNIRVPDFVMQLCYVGFTLNAWLGLFNMIPAGPFDGAKVLEWSPVVFGITVAIGVLLTFVLSNDRVLGFLLVFVRQFVGG